MHRTNDGRFPPVLHVDTDAPLYSDRDGKLITDKLWGIYYKPDFNFGGVQGGASPYKVDQDPDQVAIDPYGPDSPEFVVGEDFIDMWCSALAHCQKRFEGQMPHYKREENSGGLGCFTPDNFPVFDVFRENVYVIADSNHGYKMIGVGKLVAQELVGEKSTLLEPFRFARFAKGELHPTSHSPFPVELRNSQSSVGVDMEQRVKTANRKEGSQGRAHGHRARSSRRQVGKELVAEVRKKIDELGIEYLYLQFVSVTGRICGKGIPADHWESVAEKGFQLVYGATMNLFLNRRGDYLGYGPEAAELVGIPEPETFMQLPWDKRVARLWCTLFRNREEREDPGAFLTADSRGNLRRIHDEFKKEHGLQLRHGTEPEMMWLKKDENGQPNGGYSNPYCYHIDQFESLRPGLYARDRLLPEDGPRHDPGRSRGFARPARAQFHL